MKLIERKFLSLMLAGVITAVSDEILILSGNIVTGYIIGDAGLSAMQLIMPIYNIIVFMAFLVGFGNAISMLREAGRGNRDRSNQYFSNGMITTLGLGVLITGVLIAIRTPFINSLNVSAEISQLANDYYCGIMFFPLIIGVNYFLHECIGNECGEMFCVLGVITQLTLNIVLSLILGRVWGMFGIGISVVFSFIAGTAVLSLGFFKKGCQLKFKKFFSFKYFLSSMKLSFFNASVFLFEALYIYVINMFILSQFNESYLSIFLIITNITGIAVAICNGVLMGMKSLVGIYSSENNPLAVKRVMKICIKALILSGVVFSLLIFVFAKPLVCLLGAQDSYMITQSVFALRVVCLSILFSGLSSLYSSYLLFSGHYIYPVIFSTVEFGILQSVLPIIFSLIFGANGLWIGLFFVPLISVLVDVAIVFIKSRTFSPLLLDKKLIARSKVLDFPATAESVMKSADSAEEFALKMGYSNREALKARLLVEETGMSIAETNKCKVQIECSILAEDKLRLIFRDNGIPQNSTDADREIKSLQDYFVANIMNMFSNKDFIRATNFNRCMFSIEHNEGDKSSQNSD